jgi:hypothetical protein
MDYDIVPIVDRLKMLEQQLSGLYATLILAIKDKKFGEFQKISAQIAPLREEYSELASRMNG